MTARTLFWGALSCAALGCAIPAAGASAARPARVEVAVVIDTSRAAVGRDRSVWVGGVVGGLAAADRVAIVTYGRSARLLEGPLALGDGGRARLMAHLPRLPRTGRLTAAAAVRWAALRVPRVPGMPFVIVVLRAEGERVPARAGGAPVVSAVWRAGESDPWRAAARVVARVDGLIALPTAEARLAMPTGVRRAVAFGPGVHWRSMGAVGPALQLSDLPAGPWPLVHARALLVTPGAPLSGVTVRAGAGATRLRSQAPVPVTVRWRSPAGSGSVTLPPFGAAGAPGGLAVADFRAAPRQPVHGPRPHRAAAADRRAAADPAGDTGPAQWMAAVAVAIAALLLGRQALRRLRPRHWLEVRPLREDGPVARLILERRRVTVSGAALGPRRSPIAVALVTLSEEGGWSVSGAGARHVYAPDGVPRRVVTLSPGEWVRVADVEVRFMARGPRGGSGHLEGGRAS